MVRSGSGGCLARLLRIFGQRDGWIGRGWLVTLESAPADDDGTPLAGRRHPRHFSYLQLIYTHESAMRAVLPGGNSTVSYPDRSSSTCRLSRSTGLMGNRERFSWNPVEADRWPTRADQRPSRIRCNEGAIGHVPVRNAARVSDSVETYRTPLPKPFGRCRTNRTFCSS